MSEQISVCKEGVSSKEYLYNSILDCELPPALGIVVGVQADKQGRCMSISSH